MESKIVEIVIALYAISMIAYFVNLISKKDTAGSIATFVLFIGLLFHTFSLVIRAINAGRAPFSNMYEFTSCFSWGINLIYLVGQKLSKNKKIGAFVVPIGFLLILYASTLSKDIEPLIPALQSNWLVAHVAVAIIAYGAFALSFGTSILYIVQERCNSKKLPELNTFDRINYKSIAFAFPFMTLVIITGAVWAEKAWGRYWSWDPKEVWSLITWIIYAAYLHARVTYDWKGKRLAYLSIVGFLVVLFTFFGVNLLLSGLHSYR